MLWPLNASSVHTTFHFLPSVTGSLLSPFPIRLRRLACLGIAMLLKHERNCISLSLGVGLNSIFSLNKQSDVYSVSMQLVMADTLRLRLLRCVQPLSNRCLSDRCDWDENHINAVGCRGGGEITAMVERSRQRPLGDPLGPSQPDQRQML